MGSHSSWELLLGSHFRAVAILLTVSALVIAAALGFLVRLGDRARLQMPESVVYISPLDGKTDRLRIMERRRGSGKERVLYLAGNSWFHFFPLSVSSFPEFQWARSPVPDAVGILPSPDGRWLLVWGSELPAGAGTERTEWGVIRLSDGRYFKLTTTAVAAGVALEPARQTVLPYWEDNETVGFEGAGGGAVYDVKNVGSPAANHPEKVTTQQPESLISPRPLAEYELAEYCRKHQGILRDAYLRALEKLQRELGLSSSPGEYPWALTLGIPTSVGPGAPLSLKLAISPDGKMLARADAGVSRRLKAPWGDADVPGARIDVFVVSTKRRAWHTEVMPGAIPSTPPSRLNIVVDGVGPDSTLPEFRDLRWSRDGRYLSFTLYLYEADAPWTSSTVIVMDTRVWREVLRISNTMDAFVLPTPES